MANIAVRYIGLKDEFTDHLYNSGITWKQGEVKDVPDWAAEKLLKHSEFEDARHHKQRGKPFEVESKPVVQKEDEEKIEAPLVSLEAMTKEALVNYAHRYFGLDIPSTVKKDEMINKVRSVMGGAPKHIL